MLKLNTMRKKKMKPLCPTRMDDGGGGEEVGRRWRVLWGLDQRKAVERMFNIPTVRKKI